MQLKFEEDAADEKRGFRMQQQQQLQQPNNLLLASVGLNVIMLFFFLFSNHDDAICTTTTSISSSVSSSASSSLLEFFSAATRSAISFHPLMSTLYRSKFNATSEAADRIINLDHGDPTLFEMYWLGNGDSCTTVILGWERMSYFASREQFWFVEKELDKQIRELHSVVGNAITEGRYIVIGTGSTQLFQAALYAVSPPEQSQPAKVVSAIPYYSSYPLITDYLKSGIYKWAGDATTFQPDGSYIELVTSPNNPDGTIRNAVVNGTGPVIHDLVYYWPHYTPITAAADHDIMLFTVSKSTGHAGTRIGWAIVKDEAVAMKMSKFIEISTIGVSQDSQIRAGQIIRSIVGGYVDKSSRQLILKEQQDDFHIKKQQLFHYGFKEMNRRWERLREVVGLSDRFSLPDFAPQFCNFFGQVTSAHPAFAWLMCNKESDCKRVIEDEGILSRSGSKFGAGSNYVRISMLDRNHNFETFLQRLAAMAVSTAAASIQSSQ